MKQTNSSFIFLRAVLFVILCFSLSSCSKSEKSEVSDSKQSASSQEEVEIVKVCSANLRKTIRIPSELVAFREVSIYPKVQGFVKSVNVDRGSAVKHGDILVEVIAPELEANYEESVSKFEIARTSVLEVESKIASLIAQKEEAEAKLQGEESNYMRIQHADKTAGAIAPLDLDQAAKSVQGAQAHVRAIEQTIQAAKSELNSQKNRVKAAEHALEAVREMKSYLIVRAPFDGMIRERNVHEGSLVSSAGTSAPMLRIQESSKLRLLVPVPESAISGVRIGSQMSFTVPSFLGKIFSGTVSRISHRLDNKTRTMIVELDVDNSKNELEPGMFADVSWEMERPYKTLFVPSTAVHNADDKSYIVKILESRAEKIPVVRGQSMGNQLEVVGDLKEGDEVLLRASHGVPEGDFKTRLVSASEAESRKAEHE